MSGPGGDEGGEEGACVVHGVAVRAATVGDARHDALVLVTGEGVAPPPELRAVLDDALRLDAALRREPGVVACAAASGGRLVVAPMGPLSAYDDVRSVGEAAARGVRRALAAGATRPTLVVPVMERWRAAPLVALLSALEALYVPLEVRERFPALGGGARALGVCGAGLDVGALVRDAAALEVARGAARDVGGADPERMTPLATAEYVRALFAGSERVRVRVEDDYEVLKREYPLLAAVGRAAHAVPRHRACVIFLEYTPPEYEETVILVGKGVTYDTGGCDVKTNGAMAGMSRDKCGAAAALAFVKACEATRAPLRAVAALAMVRNSIGEEGYVADEVLKSRRGAAVRIGNTDAEGRLAMADLLAEMAQSARSERRPHLYTVATLTGHAARAYGPYTAAMASRRAGEEHARALAAAAESLGEGCEVSTVRREDLAAHRAPLGAGEALVQAEPGASTAHARGHQGPAAFLLLAAGLDAPDAPPYTHLDVAGSAGAPPHPPTAAPLLALAAHYKLVAGTY